MKAAEHTPTSAATVKRKASATAFFGHTSEQEAPFFGPKNSNQPSKGSKPLEGSSSRPTIQAKLTVGAPNDKYEQEADSMADKVVQRMGQSGTLQRQTAPSVSTAQNGHLQKMDEEKMPELQKSPVSKVGEADELQMKCADCEKEEGGAIQRKENGESEASASIESRLSASKGGGSPLSNETRGQMESAMGADFSGVRVHTGSEAVQMSQDLNAHAFTHGADVYFNSGKYNPSNTEGSRLLAHELTHTVQQGKSQSIQKQDAPSTTSPQPTAPEPTAEDYQIQFEADAAEYFERNIRNELRIQASVVGISIGQRAARAGAMQVQEVCAPYASDLETDTNVLNTIFVLSGGGASVGEGFTQGYRPPNGATGGMAAAAPNVGSRIVRLGLGLIQAWLPTLAGYRTVGSLREAAMRQIGEGAERSSETTSPDYQAYENDVMEALHNDWESTMTSLKSRVTDLISYNIAKMAFQIQQTALLNKLRNEYGASGSYGNQMAGRIRTSMQPQMTQLREHLESAKTSRQRWQAGSAVVAGVLGGAAIGAAAAGIPSLGIGAPVGAAVGAGVGLIGGLIAAGIILWD